MLCDHCANGYVLTNLEFITRHSHRKLFKTVLYAYANFKLHQNINTVTILYNPLTRKWPDRYMKDCVQNRSGTLYRIAVGPASNKCLTKQVCTLRHIFRPFSEIAYIAKFSQHLVL